MQIKSEIRYITNTMYNLASGNHNLVVPVSKNGLFELAEVLGRLMDERIEAVRPKGLKEVNAQIENLIGFKEQIDSWEIEMPDVVKTKIEGSIIGLAKEMVALEKRLND